MLFAVRISIEVGRTDFSHEDVCMILSGMEADFCGDQYHLLRKNCNHFSSAFIEVLCGAPLPKWINRLAVMSSKLPFIERSIPREWLTPIAPVSRVCLFFGGCYGRRMAYLPTYDPISKKG